jgi:hypothetical protein
MASIIIDPGHGGQDPGAVLGYDPYMDSARAKVGTTGDQSPTQSVDIRSPGIVVYFWRKIPDPSP